MPDMLLSFAGGTWTVRPSYSGSAGRLPLASRTLPGFKKSNRDSTSAYACAWTCRAHLRRRARRSMELLLALDDRSIAHRTRTVLLSHRGSSSLTLLQIRHY